MSDSNCASVLEVIDAGANACCLADVTSQRLQSAIAGVRHGDLWVDSQVAWQLIDNFRVLNSSESSLPLLKTFGDRRPGDSLESVYLTAKESEVLKLIVHGQKNQDIANSLNISLATAKAHVRNILSKLGVAHRTQAAVEAMRRGLV